MWLNIQIFGFRALWSPYFIAFVLILAISYYLITGPYRHKFTDAGRPTAFQQFSFYSGLLLLYFVKGSPVDLLSHIMLSAHMIQTALLYFLFPITMIKGLPNWMWEKVVYLPKLNPLLNFFTKPLISLFLFSSILALYHVPFIFDFSKSSKIAHASILIFILITAFLFWWPILTPFKDQDKLMPLLKIVYLVASAAIITIPCALIIFAQKSLFMAYSAQGAWLQAMALCVPNDVLTGLAPQISGPEMFSPFSLIHDQQLGGIVMMFTQQIIYGITFGRIFFNWSKENRQTIDPLPEDFRHESNH
ncbi:MAG TPA: cytochrome c oxidase assembly factor CtaG [Bacillota bacterium]|nr:cytochrome c oxidase assembly factor CtaG [Bacillota bacterium]